MYVVHVCMHIVCVLCNTMCLSFSCILHLTIQYALQVPAPMPASPQQVEATVTTPPPQKAKYKKPRNKKRMGEQLTM